MSITASHISMEIGDQSQGIDESLKAARIPEQIINATPDMIYVYDLIEGRNLYANRLAADFLGYTKEEIKELGSDLLATIIHPEDLEDVKRHHQRLRELGTNRVLEITYRIRHHDGSWRWLFSRGIPFSRSPGGEVEQILGLATDITDQKKREEHQQKLDQERHQTVKMEAVGKLAGGIAHDFNNLLQVIQGYAQLLLLDAEETSREKESLKAILKAGDKAAHLVQQLLFFSRKAKPHKMPLNLNRQIEQSYPVLFNGISPATKISLQLKSPLWTVACDRLQMEQVLLNLVRNAIEAMPEGGRLTVTTENVVLDQEAEANPPQLEPGPYVRLSVSDTGNGMDGHTTEQIFEPFFTTKEIGQGTGLSLASAYGIIKNHNGAIICNSKKSAGTVFSIYLPATLPQPLTETRTSLNGQLKGGQETILLVDDEAPVRGFGQQIFQRFGYTVLTAASGEEALDLYKKQGADIDLVILDIGMPGMGGHQCLKELLAWDPAVKVIVASGYPLNNPINNPVEEGAAGYVPKPYDLKTILESVRTVLDAPSGYPSD